MNIFGFRQPGSQEITIGCSSEFKWGFAKDSFVIAPFEPCVAEPISIPFQQKINLKDINYYFEKIRHEEGNISNTIAAEFPTISTARDKHVSMVESVLHNISDGIISKCVISKVILKEGKIEIQRTFQALCNEYQDAFVFFFHTPLTGTWMGASPELLISRRGKSFKSMSLAGTRPSESSKDWSKKDLDEQQIVTKYIEKIYSIHGLSPVIGEINTKKAGPVEHLLTFIAGSSVGEIDLRSLMKDLSPTPALSGYPRNKALKLIKELEESDRSYYGGYCGWMKNERDFDLYVNLRCMQIEENRYCLHVGGGIVKQSIPDEEWIETEKKAETLTILLK